MIDRCGFLGYIYIHTLFFLDTPIWIMWDKRRGVHTLDSWRMGMDNGGLSRHGIWWNFGQPWPWPSPHPNFNQIFAGAMFPLSKSRIEHDSCGKSHVNPMPKTPTIWAFQVNLKRFVVGSNPKMRIFQDFVRMEVLWGNEFNQFPHFEQIHSLE